MASVHLHSVLWSDVPTPTVGSSIIITNPITGTADFINPAGNYHLLPTSDAIDAGVDAGLIVDFDGQSRPQGLGFDLGFDEFVNSAPTISAPADVTTTVGTPVGPLTVTVGDLETPAASLVFSATSSNQTLVPNANILLGGSGVTRTIALTPAAGLTGTTMITLTVTDGNNATTQTTFTLTVIAAIPEYKLYLPLIRR
jgi:hypothetical protein